MTAGIILVPVTAGIILVPVTAGIIWYTSKRTQHQKIICAPLFDKKCATILWSASGFAREVYCGTFAKRAAVRRNAERFSRESAAILALQRFTKRRTFRHSVKVWHTQRDKRDARYAPLISAAAARLLRSFWRIPYV